MKYFPFCEFCGYKKGITTNFFSPLSFDEVFRSGIRDPGWVKKSQDPGSGINIPDPQHWSKITLMKEETYSTRDRLNILEMIMMKKETR
jgi:hypothetical protein